MHCPAEMREKTRTPEPAKPAPSLSYEDLYYPGELSDDGHVSIIPGDTDEE